MERVRVVAPEGGDMMTKQSMALESDINHIVSRWIHHGQVPRAVSSTPMYGDFSSFDSFHEAANLVLAAEADFARLPAHVRDHCKNDPGLFLDLVYDPERRPELEALGLVAAALPVVVQEAISAEKEAAEPASHSSVT